MGMTIDEVITRFNSNAKHELTLGNLQGCLEFRQLAEWLEKYRKIEEIIKSWKDGTIEEKDSVYAFHEIMGVIENENDD